MLSELRKRTVKLDVLNFSIVAKIPINSLEVSFSGDLIDLAARGPERMHPLISDSQYHEFHSQLHLMRMTLLAVDLATSMKEE